MLVGVREREIENLNRKGKRHKKRGRHYSTDPRAALLSWDSFQAEAKRQDKCDSKVPRDKDHLFKGRNMKNLDMEDR